MGVTFEHPAWLLLLLLAAPAAWTGLRWFASMSLIRRASAATLRIVLIALITAMLAGASAVRKTDRLAVIGVVDVSGSVRLFGHTGAGPDGKPADPLAAARAFLDAAAKARGPEDLLGVVAFDGKALAIATPTRGDLSDRSFDVKMADGTDIGGALKYAAALIPPDAAGRLVLVSDGDQNAGDALGAARALASTGHGVIPVDVAPVTLDASREVMVEAVDAPPRAAAQSTITVRVTLLATMPASGTLTLLHSTGSGAEEPLDINGSDPGFSRPVSLSPGRNVELIRVVLPQGHIHQFRAVFEPEVGVRPDGSTGPLADTRPENNTGEAFTYAPGKGSVLLMDGTGEGDGGTLASVLREAAIDVTVLSPAGLPGNLLALQAYDLVILDNVGADSVPEASQQALSDHVRQMGAGLVMIGGPDSFGAGGWKGSILEPILPVRLDLPQKLVEPDAAVVFVLDNSGSMGRPVMGSSYSQQEIANQSTAGAIKSLLPTDLVGVVVFNSDTDVLVPLGPNRDSASTCDKVLSISAGGGTVMGPALAEAEKELTGTKATVKHVIVLSDGRSSDPSILPGLCSRMHDEGITVTTIAVGDEADEKTMADMAGRGGGRFYAVSDPTLLPRFFLKAVRVIRTPLIRNGDFRPVILPAPSPLTMGMTDPPLLGGLVLTQRRPEPTITCAMQTPTGEPLLAYWTVELGQVAAFTSDARAGGWADRWIGWSGYRQLWTQAARTLARASSPDRLDLTTDVVGDTLHLRLEAAGEDARPLDLLSVPAIVKTPAGQDVKLSLAQTGPGTYEATTPAAEGGNYIAILTPSLAGRRLSPVIGGASVAFGAEFRALATNTELLSAIARETGGRVLDLASPQAAQGLFDRSQVHPTLARTPLWRPLLLWTLLVLLMDIGTRRIAWDRFVSREFGAGLKEAAQESLMDRGAGAEKSVSRLRESPRRPEPALGVSLTDADAAKLAEEAALKRQRERLAAMQAARAARREAAPVIDVEAPPTPRPRTATRPPAPPANQPGDPGDLMAAKRRARERFEAEGNRGGTNPPTEGGSDGPSD